MFNLIKHFKNKELFLALYFSLFILGISVGISPNFYNEARILEVLLLLGLGLYDFINKDNIFFKKELFFLFFIFIGLFFWSNYQMIFFETLLFYFLYKLFFNLNYNKTISKLIIFFSFLVFIMFPFSLWKYLNTGLYINWYPLPWNIRIYNSYFLIFSIFAIWFYLKEIQYKNIYLGFVFFAFLSILLDGGRSATLAYTFFIIFVCIFNSLIRVKLLFTYGLSWLAYFSIIHFSSHSTSGLITLNRESTSGRYELWINAFECWIQSPIFGCGFYQLDRYSGLSAHPHNLFIQILTETGLIGFIFLCFILFSIAKNISWDFKKNYFVLAALGTIVIELSFSGIHIYPVTQIALLWLFVFLLKNPEFSHAIYFNQLVIQNSKYIKIINFIIYVIVAVVFFYLFVHTSVLTESLPLTPPRFWEYGYQLY